MDWINNLRDYTEDVIYKTTCFIRKILDKFVQVGNKNLLYLNADVLIRPLLVWLLVNRITRIAF